jgi:hypothetical protein
MTIDELKAMPLKYTFGYSAEDHGLRQYKSEDGLIAKMVVTPRKISTGEWGMGEAVYMLTDTQEEFDTVQGLLDAINARQAK